MNASPDPDPPRHDLRVWRVVPPADAGFRAAVWARVEAARRLVELSWSAYLRRHALLWSVALLLAVGGSAVLGRRAGAQHTRAEHDTILHTYLAAIDARAMQR